MMKKTFVVAAVCGCAFAAEAEWSSLASGWRLTVGPTMNGAVKSSVHARGALLRDAPPAAAGGDSRAAAQAKGDALERGERLEFPGGGFIDPDDAAGTPGETWNWKMPAGAMNGGKLSGTHPYSESVLVETSRGAGGSDNDRDSMLGVSFGFDKEIGRWGDFGVDAGFLFSYFRKRRLIKASAAYSRAYERAEGDYVTDVALDPAVAGDPWFANADGTFGAGTFDGPGPVVSFGDISHRWANERRVTSVETARTDIRGDYEEFALQLALKPWYAVTENFRVVGILGLEVSRAAVALSTDVWRDGAGRRRSRTSDAWDVCGVTGAGALVRWKDFCLGADVLTRFGDEKLRVHTAGAGGYVRRADLTCRVYAGWEF